jgi:hypothetical protein
MNERIAANREAATLKTAQIRNVEGSGIRFAYRQIVSPAVAASAKAVSTRHQHPVQLELSWSALAT